MRLPRQRTQRYVAGLYRSGTASEAAEAHAQHGARAGAFAAALTESGLFQPSHSDASTPRPRRTKLAPKLTMMTTTTSKASARQDKLDFFALMEREEEAQRAGRLSIHRSDHLVRNSADLTTFLNAALRTGDWQDGLKAFAEATALPAFRALLDENVPTTSSPFEVATAAVRGGAGLPAASAVPVSGVNPNAGQVVALLDMCAKAEQYPLVEKIGAFFAPAFPEAFVRCVELLAAASTSHPSSVVVPGWRAAFAYLTTRCPLPAAEIPLEAFNVCLRGCEEAKDWRGALEVIRAMGPNPLQGWTSLEEDSVKHDSASASPLETIEENTTSPSKTSSSSSSLTTAAEAAAAGTTETGTSHGGASSSVATADGASAASLSTPPSPNVVSYATLIATLEQAGKNQIASAVLNRLPAVEKEEITASYAALIFVWSNQVLHKRRRRF
jgi:hypothetical protein